jgi:CheY-like chemotaxis protein
MIILHVDDDPDDRNILSDAIKEVHPTIKCLQAEDAIQGQRILTESFLTENVSCIFLDINMPLMDGVELLALIKADQRLSKVPVYVYSTTSNPREVECIHQLGGKFLLKQSSYRQLVTTLHDILKPLINSGD